MGEASLCLFGAKASTALASSLDYEVTLKQVAELAVHHIADWCSVVTYQDGKLQRAAVAHADPKRLKFAEEFTQKYPEELRDDRGTGRMLKTGRSELFSDVPDELLVQVARDDEHLRLMRELGIVSAIGVPLVARGRALGVLRLISADSKRRFTQDDLALAEDLAFRAALAVDNARLHRESTQNETQFRQLADAIPQLAWMANPDGWIFWYNRRWYEYTGTTPEQMEGWGWQSVHHPDSLPTVMEKWTASIKSGEQFEMVFPLRGSDGVFRNFLTRVVPIREATGAVLRWFGTNTDVDEIRRTQDALRQSEAHLRLSQERLRITQRAAKIATWELDLDNDRYLWSEEVFEMLGRRDIGTSQRDFLSLMYYSADQESAREALRVATTRNKEYVTQFRIMRSDGEARWIAARGKQFYNQGKSVMIGVFIDISEAKGAMASRKTTLKKARSLPKSKPKRVRKQKPGGR